MSHASALSVPLSEYNLIVENDYTHAGGSVYGKALIGGDLLGGSPAEFASRVTPGLDIDSLTVLGDIKNSVHVKTGNVVLGGAVTNGANVDLQGGSSATIKAANSSDINEFNNAITNLKDASSYYASLSSNTSYTVTDHTNDWDFSYNGTSDVAVFSGSAADIFKNNAQIRFDNVLAETLIFNISGTNVNIGNTGWNLPGFDFNGTNGLGASNILWNFYEAETLTLGSSGFIGSVMAMNADVTLSSTLDGAIGAKSLWTNRQIHDYNFSTPPSPVPIPGSLILFGSALMIFGTVRRKYKKA
jgi:choice-of-anchor A domain-containing protein